MRRSLRNLLLLCIGVGLADTLTHADCTLTNTGVAPLNELGFNSYKGFAGGLYPNSANPPPAAHLAAGLDIAQNQIQPLDANGNADPNNGVIALLSLGMSNTTQEWASGDAVTHNITNAFK